MSDIDFEKRLADLIEAAVDNGALRNGDVSRLNIKADALRDYFAARIGKPEAEPASCAEPDGCPTEMAVLKRFWRAQHANLAANKHARMCTCGEPSAPGVLHCFDGAPCSIPGKPA